MLDLLVFGAGAVVASGLRPVLVRLRSGRWSGPPPPNAYLPPPAGHRAVAGGRTLECACGWCWTASWPPTGRRLDRARLDHYWAVEQQRVARRLGIDADSLLDQVVAVREAARHAQQAARPGPGGSSGPTGAGSGPARRLEGARSSRRAVEARRASAIARVEASRVLPKYTSDNE